MRTRFAGGVLLFAVIACAAFLIGASLRDDLTFVSRAGTSLCKLACLLIGAAFSVASARAFEPGSPARRGWIAFAVFQSAWTLAQLWFCFVVIVRRAEVTVPSVADVLFVGGQLAAFFALFTFIEAWRSSGLVAPPSWSQRFAGAVTALSVVVAAGMTALAHHGVLPAADSIVVSIYPVLDCALLWPLVLLLAMSRGMGEGRVAVVWRHVLLGVLACGVGDFAYAFFAQLGVASLDPLIDFAFCASYAYIGFGAVRQDALASA
ncbi:MAG: hypothetical protein ACAI38_03700 [Myxococcota bacterium]|nr:hypothetical protein [Myxococcota bacterium]